MIRRAVAFKAMILPISKRPTTKAVANSDKPPTPKTKLHVIAKSGALKDRAVVLDLKVL